MVTVTSFALLDPRVCSLMGEWVELGKVSCLCYRIGFLDLFEGLQSTNGAGNFRTKRRILNK